LCSYSRISGFRLNLAGQRLFTRIDGRLHATPLLLALATVETADIIFAVDSVPAIFAITNEPFLVYSSNVFAILGLRSMYFLLAGAVGRFHLLRYGLAAVLIFIGLKMSWLNAQMGRPFSHYDLARYHRRSFGRFYRLVSSFSETAGIGFASAQTEALNQNVE
jgi:TerC family integral membrane protein